MHWSRANSIELRWQIANVVVVYDILKLKKCSSPICDPPCNQLPNRAFCDFRASKLIDRRFWAPLILLIRKFGGSTIVTLSIGWCSKGHLYIGDGMEMNGLLQKVRERDTVCCCKSGPFPAASIATPVRLRTTSVIYSIQQKYSKGRFSFNIYFSFKIAQEN